MSLYDLLGAPDPRHEPIPPLNTVITSDLPLRLDGQPYASGRSDDPGIAVYWSHVLDNGGHAERCMACDRWDSHGGNIRALAMSIEALRGLDRWGSSSLVERAFAGFAALPPAPDDWRSILGAQLRTELAADAHPDRGGSDAAMQRLNAAREAAERELGA